MNIFMIRFINLKSIKDTRDKLVSSGKSNCSFRLYWDILLWNLLFGYDPSEYSAYNFIDISFKDRFSFISFNEQILFARSINNNFNYDILSKKQNTYLFYKEYFHREQIIVKSQDDYSSFNDFIKRHPIFFCKPFNGSCGNGTSLIDVSNQCSDKIFNNLVSSGTFILEEIIEQSNEMAQFNDTSINTVRTTMLKINRDIVLLFGFIRCGRKGSIVDNGGAGGIIVPYNPITGKLSKLGFDESGKTYWEHPDSHVSFENFQIPRWKEICDLSIKLTEMTPNIVYVGWDLAITNDGITLVEGNSRPMFVGLQGIHSIGFKTELELILRRKIIPKEFKTKQMEIFS